VGGSGRSSLVRLAAFIADMELHELNVTRNYGEEEWREDLKKVIREAGLQNKPIIFLFRDAQILLETFLEDINNLIQSGNVPDLFQKEEIDAIQQSLAVHTTTRRYQDFKHSTELIYAKFISQVKRNLHVVLCLDPSSPEFKSRMRLFPSIVTCCTIDWYSKWSESALKSVARHILSTWKIESNEIDSIVNACVFIHQSVVQASKSYQQEMRGYSYVTTAKHLEFLAVVQVLSQ
jgi:dynein heavy chain